MADFGCLLEKYDKFVLFDTETTGLQYSRDEIIEFSAVVLEKQGTEAVETRRYDELICLTPGNKVPPEIVQLTGITNEAIAERGISKEKVCADIGQMFAGNTLLLAYNAHFDLSFLYYLLLRHADPAVLRRDKLDLLTVYKDRRAFPHKLCNAIESYGLSGRVVNSHRASDDVVATAAVMAEMCREKDDLINYVNLFGYSAKYGISGKPIGSVTYKPQGFEPGTPLYLK